MNRETKRMMQRQGQGPEGGAPDRRKQPAPRRAAGERTSPVQFVKEVRSELRRVAWPGRGEVVNYSAVVLLTLVILVGLIFVLDFLFAKAILFLFDA